MSSLAINVRLGIREGDICVFAADVSPPGSTVTSPTDVSRDICLSLVDKSDTTSSGESDFGLLRPGPTSLAYGDFPSRPIFCEFDQRRGTSAYIITNIHDVSFPKLF